MSWTAIADGLPDHKELVLVIRKGGLPLACFVPNNVWVSYLEADGQWRDVLGILGDITHWHRIPDPPEELL